MTSLRFLFLSLLLPFALASNSTSSSPDSHPKIASPPPSTSLHLSPDDLERFTTCMATTYCLQTSPEICYCTNDARVQCAIGCGFDRIDVTDCETGEEGKIIYLTKEGAEGGGWYEEQQREYEEARREGRTIETEEGEGVVVGGLGDVSDGGKGGEEKSENEGDEEEEEGEEEKEGEARYEGENGEPRGNEGNPGKADGSEDDGGKINHKGWGADHEPGELDVKVDPLNQAWGGEDGGEGDDDEKKGGDGEDGKKSGDGDNEEKDGHGNDGKKGGRGDDGKTGEGSNGTTLVSEDDGDEEDIEVSTPGHDSFGDVSIGIEVSETYSMSMKNTTSITNTTKVVLSAPVIEVEC